MYLPLLQDFIAVGQPHYVRYPSENLDTQKPPSSCEQDFSSALNSKTQGSLSIRTDSQSIPVDPQCFPEPQSAPHPIYHVPSICVIPPEAMTTEPVNHTSESKITENQEFNTDDQSITRSCGRETTHITGAESNPKPEALIDQPPRALYEHLHFSERITKDYDDWLKLAQGAAANPCEDGVAADGRASPSIASPDACYELVLWKPMHMPFVTKSRDYERKLSLGRRFSLNQSVIYPFRTKRNSV